MNILRVLQRFPLFKTPPQHLRTGKIGEKCAYTLLKTKGYKILHRNFNDNNYGELDIVAIDGATLCFIEVKTRTSRTMNRPADGLAKEQRGRIIKSGYAYHKSLGAPKVALRFDLIEVVLNSFTISEIRHWTNAIRSDKKNIDTSY